MATVVVKLGSSIVADDAGELRTEVLQAASAVGQGKLYRSYDELLQQRGVPSAQVLLTFFDMSARTHYLNARHTLQTLLRWRVLPVINENDTTTTDEISFGDNDFLAAQVAILIGADRLVLLTDTGGLYNADPPGDPDAPLVEGVDPGGGADGHPLPRAGGPRVELQALAQVREAHARAAGNRRGRGAGAPRARHEPAAG